MATSDTSHDAKTAGEATKHRATFLSLLDGCIGDGVRNGGRRCRFKYALAFEKPVGHGVSGRRKGRGGAGGGIGRVRGGVAKYAIEGSPSLSELTGDGRCILIGCEMHR